MVTAIEHGQFRAIVHLECVLRFGKRPAARRRFRLNDHRGRF